MLSKKHIVSDSIYRNLLMLFVVSLCFFHGKVVHIGFIRNNPSDFLTYQIYISQILLFLIVSFIACTSVLNYRSENTNALENHDLGKTQKKIFARMFQPTNFILISLLLFTTWAIIPRGMHYNFYYLFLYFTWITTFYIFYKAKFGLRIIIYRTISILAVIESVIGLIQFHLKHSIGLHWFGEPIMTTMTNGIAKIDLPNGMKFIRSYGTFSHPNSLGAFLLIAFAFTSYLISRNRKNGIGQILNYLFLFIILLGLTVTFSRAAYVALAFFLAIFCIFELKKTIPRGNTKKLIVYSTFVLISLGICIVSYATYLSTRATIDDSSTAQRLAYDSDGLAILKSNPVIGIGIGNTIYKMNSIIPANAPTWAIQPPHNYLIIVSDETGIIGLVLFLLVLLAILRNVTVDWRQGNAAMQISLFVALMIIMQFDHYFYDIPLMGLLFWMTLGIISGVANEAAPNKAIENV